MPDRRSRWTCWMAWVLRGILAVGVGVLLLLPPRPTAADVRPEVVRLVRSTPQAAVLEFTLPDYALRQLSVQGREFVQVSADGLLLSAEPGAPQLPQMGVLIGLPPTDVPSAGSGQVPSLRVLETEETQVSLSHPVYPAPIPMPVQMTAQGRPAQQGHLPTALAYEFALDEALYATDVLHPASAVEVMGVGWIRDHCVARVIFHPVRYNPVRGELVVTQRLVVEVRFEHGGPVLASDMPGAESPAFERLLRRAVLNYETAQSWRASRPVREAGAASNGPATQSGSYKVMVDTDGLYRLTYADLQAAGLPVESIDPRTFQLFEQGQEIAIEVIGQQDGVFGTDDAILFYGRGPRSRYTDRNVCWLRFGDGIGLRMTARAVNAGPQPADAAWTTARHEENRLYDPLFPAADGDHWYAADLLPGAGGMATLALVSPAADVPTATLRVRLVGYTHSASVNPDHHAAFAVNGHAVGDLWWEGNGAITATVTLDAAVLQPGDNPVTVSLPGDTGAAAEGVWLDAVELDYACRTVSAGIGMPAYDIGMPAHDVGMAAYGDDELFFWAQAGARSYALDGFGSADLSVYDVTDPWQPVPLQGVEVTGSGNYTLSFADAPSQPVIYYALAGTRIRSPLAVVADVPSDLYSAANGADYLVVTHADFAGALVPLVAHREAQGLRVKVVDVQDVYDEFSGGLPDPEAIRSFVAYAYHGWAVPAPTYILLVGDGSYDFLDHYGYGSVTCVPPYLGMFDPWWGEMAADNRYATIVGDDILPDVLLGRLPVTSVTEATAAVRKIVDYEQDPRLGDWNARHVFVADDADSAGDFAGALDEIYDAFVIDPWLGQKIYMGDLPAEAAQQETLAAWQRGALLITFMGHSSWHQWAVESLFDIHDVPALRNDQMWPLVLSMTCFTGFFHHPEYGTLDESLLRLGGGGAVATWSPSGLGLQAGHQQLHHGFYSSVFEKVETQLGPATLAAKLELHAYTSAYDDLLDTYHLFGDPAMALNLTLRPWPHSIYLPLLYRDSLGG